MKRIGQIALLSLLVFLVGCKSKEAVGTLPQPGEKDKTNTV